MRDQTLVLLCALALANAGTVRFQTKADHEVYADPKLAPTICAAPNSDGILVAHEHCNQYYQCWNGNPVARQCSSDLQYNPLTGICDWPHSVECGARIVPECHDEQDNANEAPEICASEGSEELLIAHSHCDKFYKCLAGRPVAYKCPGHLLYNAAVGYCDCASNVACGDRIVTESEEENNGNGNDNPSEAPAICTADDSDGVLVAHEHCNMFYKCNHGEPTEFKCFGDLLFNPAVGHCDWSENVDCGDRTKLEKESDENNKESESHEESDNGSDNGGSGTCNCNPGEAPSMCAQDGSDGTLIAHENCCQYYQCVHGVPVARTCPNGLLYNPYKEQCDWANNVKCGDRVIPEKDSSENGGAENENGDNDESANSSTENGETDNGGSATCNCSPGEAPSLCRKYGSDGTLIAHENCNKYYICVHGQPVAQKCQNGLLYNPYDEHCDWPNNVECGDRIIPQEESAEIDGGDSGNSDSSDTDNGGSENGGSESGGSGTCNCNPGEAPSLCAEDESDGTLIAHENCGKYYQCVHGVPTAQSCPLGLLYNPYKEHCDWYDNVDCGDRTVPEENSTENGGSDNGSDENGGADTGGTDDGGSDNGSSGSCNCNPGEAPSMCAQDGSDGTLIAHENCCQYYQCVHGVPVAQTCPNGLLYNPYKEQCDWANNVKCGDRVIPEKDSSENEDDDESANSSTENGETDNGGSGTCNCSPGEAPSLCGKEGSDGLLIAHQNCNKYYICVHGQPVAQKCQNGLLYNPYDEHCDWPHNVECGDRIIAEESVEIDGDDSSNSGSEDTDNDGTENGGSESGGSGTCNCDPGEAPSLCAEDESDGTLIVHENCGKYYQCVHGVPIAQSCPLGLLYNPYKEHCDWSDNVDCGDRTLPEENSTENGGSDNGSGGNGDSDTGGTDNGGSDNGSSGSCNCNPDEALLLCAAVGSDGTLVAHENCNKYYQCVHGHPIVQHCSSGLLYNPYKEVCDWPDNVECGDRTTSQEDCEEDSNENDSTDNGDSGNGESENGTCNCNPSEAPTLCAQDRSDGKLIAHENCNKFYICVHGQPIAQKCQSGLLYNPYEERCDWAVDVKCGDRVVSEEDCEDDNNESGETDNAGDNSGSEDETKVEDCYDDPSQASTICGRNGSDGTFVAHENCNQFYVCLTGEAVALDCPTNLLYNPNTKQCDWPENVRCGDRVKPKDDDKSDENTSSEDSGSSGCNCNPDEAPSLCANKGSDGVLVAHENCNKFYQCVHGQPVAQECHNGLLYNPYSETCDWADNVECGNRFVPEDDCEEGSESENSDNDTSENGGSDNGSNIEDSHDNPSQAPVICARDDSEGTFVAHENCTQLYVCLGGQPVVLNCPNNLLYNPLIKECDWPENVNCGDRIMPDNTEDCEDNNNFSGEETTTLRNSSEGDSSIEEDSKDNGDKDNEHVDFVDDSKASEYCQTKGSGFEFLPHQKCNKFYACVGSDSVVLSCAGDLLYNCQTMRCEFAEDVQCGKRLVPDRGDNEETEQDISDAKDEDNKSYESAEKDDANEIDNDIDEKLDSTEKESTQEIDNDSDEKTDSAEKEDTEEIEDDSDEKVDTDDQVDENNGIDSEIAEYCALSGSEERVLPHENCNQYYICIGGVPVVRSCSGQFLFNANIGLCDWPQNVNCDSQGAGGAAENGGNDGNNGESDKNTDVSEVHSSEEEEETKESNAAALCSLSGSNNRVLPHDNCANYYICVNSIPQVRSCSGQFLFNENALQCDWPQNVDCGNRVL